MNAAAIEQLARQGIRLLLTVDCGITAVHEIALARHLGMDVIITDHHQPSEVLPDAWALLNPHQPACTYPNKGLCGVGVMFKLLTALRAALRQANLFTDRLPNLKRHLDLVTLGTIADVTPLQGENRVIVSYGLQELTQTRKRGLQALRQVSGRAGQIGHGGRSGVSARAPAQCQWAPGVGRRKCGSPARRERPGRSLSGPTPRRREPRTACPPTVHRSRQYTTVLRGNMATIHQPPWYWAIPSGISGLSALWQPALRNAITAQPFSCRYRGTRPAAQGGVSRPSTYTRVCSTARAGCGSLAVINTPPG